MVEWFKALVMQSGGPGFKTSTLPLAGFVSRWCRVQILASWDFKLCYVYLKYLFPLFQWHACKLAKLSAVQLSA